MSQHINQDKQALLAHIKENAGMSIFLGIVMLIMGLLAFAMPLMVGRSVAIIVGVLAVIAGVPQVVLAFKMGLLGKGLWTFVLGIITLVFGFLMIGRPLFGLATLTVFLSVFFLASGIFDVVWAFKLRPIKGWRLTLIVGIITLLIGLMIWRNFPLSGARVVGFLVGMRLVFGGWVHIGLGGAVRREAKKAQQAAS